MLQMGFDKLYWQDGIYILYSFSSFSSFLGEDIAFWQSFSLIPPVTQESKLCKWWALLIHSLVSFFFIGKPNEKCNDAIFERFIFICRCGMPIKSKLIVFQQQQKILDSVSVVGIRTVMLICDFLGYFFYREIILTP